MRRNRDRFLDSFGVCIAVAGKRSNLRDGSFWVLVSHYVNWFGETRPPPRDTIAVDIKGILRYAAPACQTTKPPLSKSYRWRLDG